MAESTKYIRSNSSDYDLATISWVDNRLAVTGMDGAQSVFGGHDVFVINTAKEVTSPSDFKLAVDPNYSTAYVRECLNALADVIQDVITNTDKKVIVHCYAGIERSVLTCMWYLCKYRNRPVDDAFSILADARPVAIDRRTWAGGKRKFPHKLK